MSIALTVWREDQLLSESYICDSMDLRRTTKELHIHFSDGSIVLDENSYSGLVIYPHMEIETSVFNPTGRYKGV